VKIGLALGAGSARGLAHIGVIRALTERGIPISVLAGTSAGALVGSMWASGSDLAFLERMTPGMGRKLWADFGLVRSGLLHGKKMEEMIGLLTRGRRFEDLPVPFACIATDIETGERVVFKEGPLAPAVRASCSIPGVFQPQQYQNRLLVDGALVERVPVRTARELGADRVIAVDVTVYSERAQVHGLVDVIGRSMDILQRQFIDQVLAGADIIIRPNLADIGAYAFEQGPKAAQRGREATLEVIDSILSWL
jgi:NTE family protein